MNSIFYGDNRKLVIKVSEGAAAVTIGGAFYLFTVSHTLGTVSLFVGLSSVIFVIYLSYLPTLRRRGKATRSKHRNRFIVAEVAILLLCGLLLAWPLINRVRPEPPPNPLAPFPLPSTGPSLGSSVVPPPTPGPTAIPAPAPRIERNRTQTRPFLVVADIVLTQLVAGKVSIVDVSFKNTGQDIADRVRTHAAAWSERIVDMEASCPELPVRPPMKFESESSVGPGGGVEIRVHTDKPITDGQVAAIENKQNWLYVYAIAEYQSGNRKYATETYARYDVTSRAFSNCNMHNAAK